MAAMTNPRRAVRRAGAVRGHGRPASQDDLSRRSTRWSKQGALTVPVIGVAFPPWTRGAAPPARDRQHPAVRRQGRPPDAQPSAGAAPLRVRRLQRRRRPSRRSRARWARPKRPRALSRHSAGAVRHGDPGARRRRPGAPGARHRREAVRARSGLRAPAQRRRAGGVSRGCDLPDRPLSREGGDHEHPLLPLRQFLPRADLEPQLRRQRADHPGRAVRRRTAAARSTKRPAACAT